ncbi:MAG: hypothetical protein QOE36_2127 [Gaiellaceae bacterium]|nr:hypothetical protein [Gaiellaceae bacterium]
MAALQELRERRAFECRLTPDRALGTLEDAEAFLRDRGLLTRTADSALPSLYEACHEEPYKAGSRGFGSWPATKWPWTWELARRPGIYSLKLHRGQTLLVSDEIVALLDPICRAELARMAGEDENWSRLLGHLAAVGPSLREDLLVELQLKPKELKSILSPLERCGAVVSRPIVDAPAADSPIDRSEYVRWDQAFPEPASGPCGIEELLVAATRAAVVAPERELSRWFSWPRRVEPGLVDRLVAEGRLERPEPGWVAVPASA